MNKNTEIADLFDRMAALLEIKGENPFKVRAYQNAAEKIRSFTDDVCRCYADGCSGVIAGIGKVLEEKIREYCQTGRLKAYEELTGEIPESLLTVVQIPTVGTKKAKLFFEKLGIKDASGLKKAAVSGDLFTLPGIREKTVAKILDGIRLIEQGASRMMLAEADALAAPIEEYLKSIPGVKNVSVAGSLRRRKETVGDIDFLVASEDRPAVAAAVAVCPGIIQVLDSNDEKISVLLKGGVRVDVHIVDPKQFGSGLLYFTGCRGYTALLNLITDRSVGLMFSEKGVFRKEPDGTETLVASETEEACFKALGQPLIAPEVREMGDPRWSLPEKDPLPKLIEPSDIRGDLHVHSTWSDGKHSIEDMVRAAQDRGYEYLAVSDHSQSLKVAGGLSIDRLKDKKEEIDRVQMKYPDVKILFGTEVDIDADGNLDYPDDVLAQFDVVIAAVHSVFSQTPEQLTHRLIKACAHPAVNILAHPTGVHFGKRGPLNADWDTVFSYACHFGVLLEINASPARMDLDSDHVIEASLDGEQLFIINTDAHHVDQLKYMTYGVSIARRGWLTKERVANTRPWTELKKIFNKR